MKIILYLHILGATAWIGGALLLFVLGIAIRDKKAQDTIYFYIGPLYGYFESFWLTILIATGGAMFFYYNLDQVLLHTYSYQSKIISIKLMLVALITIFTILHMYIAFKTHKKERTKLQAIFSRISSIMIFFLNFFILWYAIKLREFL